MLKIALVDDNTDFLLLLRKKVHTFFDGRNVLCEVRLFPNPEVFYLSLIHIYDVPASFKGMPIILITAGLMAIAFCGFSGLSLK